MSSRVWRRIPMGCIYGALLGCVSIGVLAAPAAVAPAPVEPPLRILTKYSATDGVTARPYADVEHERLYVPRGARVDVLDLRTGERVGQIAPLRRAGPVAIDPRSKRGFVVDGAANRIVVFDAASLAITKTIASGGDAAAAIEMDRDTGRLFVLHAASKDVVAIDPRSLRLIGRVSLDGAPRQLVSNHYGRIFITLGDRDCVQVVDSRALRAVGSFPLFGGQNPDGIGIDPINRRLFVAGDNGRLAVLDSDIGFPLATLPIAPGASSVVVDVTPVPGEELEKPAVIHAYVASTQGPLSVVRMLRFDSFVVTQSLDLQRPSSWLALDGSHRVIVAAAARADIAVAGR